MGIAISNRIPSQANAINRVFGAQSL